MSGQPDPIPPAPLSPGEPLPVAARSAVQCGLTYLVGHCPRCRFRICLASAGRIVCQCGAHLCFEAPQTEETSP